MDRKKALAKAKELNKQGMNAVDIAAELKRLGHKSERTGKPLTAGGVTSMLHSKRWPSHNKTSKGSGRRKSGGGTYQKKYSALVAILKAPGLSDADKIALMQLFIQS